MKKEPADRVMELFLTHLVAKFNRLQEWIEVFQENLNGEISEKLKSFGDGMATNQCLEIENLL